MLKPLVSYPDPRLEQVSEPIVEIDDAVRDLVQDMLDTLNTIGGVGIAAPQIGVFRRVVEKPQEFVPIINPVITILDKAKHIENEGCLSVPDFRAKVTRPRRVALDGLDMEGKPVHYEGEGYFGACLQHETDHLNGKLFIDHISYLKRSIYEKKMKKK